MKVKSVNVQAEEQNSAAVESELCVWGSDSECQLGVSNFSYEPIYSSPRLILYKIKVTKILCGYEHTLVKSGMGNAYAMGSNKHGQLGIGPTVKKREKPTLIPFSKSKKIWKIAAGAYHSLLYTSEKEIHSFGKNNKGQLGTGNRFNKFFPTKVDFSFEDDEEDDFIIRDMDAGLNTSALVTDTGYVYVWGCNDSGQLGLSINDLHKVKPQKIRDFTDISNVACGEKHTLFLTKTKEVYICGKNENQDLGIGIKMKKLLTPIKLNLDFNIDEIMASDYSAMVTEDKKLFVWGDSPLGFFTEPFYVEHEMEIESLGIGNSFFIFKDTTEMYFSAGINEKGQLGIGNTDLAKGLQNIEALNGREIQSISCGKNFTIILVDLKKELVRMSMMTSQQPMLVEKMNMSRQEDSRQKQEEQENEQGQDWGVEEEYEYEFNEEVLKKFISLFELTRRDYINLFQKVLHNQPEMLEKLSLKMLQIIMAKEYKIEQFLKETEFDLGGSVIQDNFLEPYTYEKKVKVVKMEEENGEMKEQITSKFRLTKSLCKLLVSADIQSEMAQKMEEYQNKFDNIDNSVKLEKVDASVENLDSICIDLEEISGQFEQNIEVINHFIEEDN